MLLQNSWRLTWWQGCFQTNCANTRMKAFQQVGHRHWGDDWDLPRRGKARLCSSTRWIFFFAVFFHLLVSSVQLDGTFYFLTLTLLIINSLLFSTQRISSLYWLQFEPTAWLTRCLLANSLRRPTRLGTRESSSLSSGCLCKNYCFAKKPSIDFLFSFFEERNLRMRGSGKFRCH